MNSSPILLALSLGSMLAFLPISTQATPPPNDNFANRQVLTGQAVSSVPITIDDATREGLERQDTGIQTVWYTWTAPQDGIVTMNTASTNFYNSRISVFNGTDLPGLVAIAKGNANYYLSTVTFFSKAGFVYQIAIGVTSSGENGTAVLNIINKATTITAPVVIATPAGTNDNFAQAVPLSAPNVSAFTYPLEATREGLEPDSTGNQTVWWTWTAPADAQVTMSNVGSSAGASYFDGFLSVYNGTSLANLTTVAQNQGASTSVTFPVKAGSQYYVCVGEDEDVEGGDSTTATTSVLNITTAPLAIASPVIIESLAAANDNFANAQDLGSNPIITGFGFNSSATTETLESSADGRITLWWNWTAPQDGNLTVSTNGTDFVHYLTVSTGSGLADLKSGTTGSASAGGNAGGTIPVLAGTVYHFVIGAQRGQGTAVLNLNFSAGLTHVGVMADAAVYYQSQSSTANFTLTRDGDLSSPVTVTYSEKLKVDGSVNTITGTKKFKAGKSTAKVKIGTGGNYGKAAVKLTITAGTGYVVGNPAKAKLTVFGD